MYYGYIKTDSGENNFSLLDANAQKAAIQKYCLDNGLSIDEFIYDDCGPMVPHDILRLGYLLDKMVEGDVLICKDASRLSRLNSEQRVIKRECKRKGISLIILSLLK